MNTQKPLAHVAENGRLHPLSGHLQGSSELASQFAAEFGCAGWGWLLTGQ
jgi:hypothetical protein